MSEKIPFYKMTGSGNDFILIDNRKLLIDSDSCTEFVKSACRRKYSVGADGLILIENDSEVDFRWRFFNSDGSEAEMCGNGGRCAARFAVLMGISKTSGEKRQYGEDLRNETSTSSLRQSPDLPVRTVEFRTLAGIIRAEVRGTKVKLQMTPPQEIETNFDLELNNKKLKCNFVNTGVPHTVIFLRDTNELEEYGVFKVGREIRHHPKFKPAGTNVNFVVPTGKHSMRIRTYERGVEDETLACGTGSIAGAIIGACLNLVESPVEIKTKSGERLTAYFERDRSGFKNVYLEGDALVVYDGIMWRETITGIKGKR